MAEFQANRWRWDWEIKDKNEKCPWSTLDDWHEWVNQQYYQQQYEGN